MKQSINDYIKCVWTDNQTQGKEIPSRIQLAADILKKFKQGITPHAVGLRENKLGLKREWKTPDIPSLSKPLKRMASGLHLAGIKATPKSRETKKGGKLEKILFIPDCHFPFQDELAFNLMMEAAKDFKPDHVVICGDFIDMYSVSAHDKNPKRAMQLELEITASVDALWRVKGLGAKTNVFVSGNHEDRLNRYLMQKAPELFGLINIETVLALDKLGFTYVPYKSDYKLGKLRITHDTGKAGYNAHKQALDAYHRSVVIGHTHRIGYMVQGDADGDKHVGAMFGWLGNAKEVDYMHSINVKKDWALGFGIGYLNPENDYVYLVPIPIVNYSCVVEGKLYTS